jgi:hypothetical protein
MLPSMPPIGRMQFESCPGSSALVFRPAARPTSDFRPPTSDFGLLHLRRQLLPEGLLAKAPSLPRLGPSRPILKASVNTEAWPLDGPRRAAKFLAFRNCARNLASTYPEESGFDDDRCQPLPVALCTVSTAGDGLAPCPSEAKGRGRSREVVEIRLDGAVDGDRL